MGFVRIFMILLMLFYTSLAAMCPLGWYRYGESCFYFIVNPVNWYQANATCAEMHGTLAVPRSWMEQTFIWEMYHYIINDQPPKSLWIDCNDIEEEGNWKQCEEGYQNWRLYEPNDFGGREDCAVIWYNGGKWNDFICSRKIHAVCQQPADTSSIPAYCLHTGSDGRISSRCLVGHVLKELPADGVVSCGKACRLEPRCLSFNVLDEGEEKMTCQLNNVTSDAANEWDLDETENCYLFDM